MTSLSRRKRRITARPPITPARTAARPPARLPSPPASGGEGLGVRGVFWPLAPPPPPRAGGGGGWGGGGVFWPLAQPPHPRPLSPEAGARGEWRCGASLVLALLLLCGGSAGAQMPDPPVRILPAQVAQGPG